MLAALQDRYIQSLVAIAVAGVLPACSDSTPICEQAEFDVCAPCAQDKDCSAASERGEVCAPDMECWPPNELQTVTVYWTIGGQPATATTCQGLPNELDVVFDNAFTLKPDTIDSGLVPCTAGSVVQDQVPPDLVRIVILGPNQTLGEAAGGPPSVTVDL
jgi:hypothetical protein